MGRGLLKGAAALATTFTTCPYYHPVSCGSCLFHSDLGGFFLFSLVLFGYSVDVGFLVKLFCYKKIMSFHDRFHDADAGLDA